MSTTRNTFLLLSCFFLVIAVSSAFIDFDYYSNDKNGCPCAEDIVKGVVKEYVENDRGLGAGLIRMFFHDCFVRVYDLHVPTFISCLGSKTTYLHFKASEFNSIFISLYILITKRILYQPSTDFAYNRSANSRP